MKNSNFPPLPTSDVHADLGCGTRPRNPYGRTHLLGLDIRPGLSHEGATILAANLFSGRIPLPDSCVDSVSAYDFLEHVPRWAGDLEGNESRFIFIELMNEIWRILKPDGLLYAVTPAFPHEKAFRDPTHVNVICNKTHRYFTKPELGARMYGFTGTFELTRQLRVKPGLELEPSGPALARRLGRLFERATGKASHLVWEFRAKK